MKKFSAYVNDDELFDDVKLLANYDGISLTAIITHALKLYTESRKNDVTFLREQRQARLQRKQEHD